VPSKYKALSSIHSTAEKNKRKEIGCKHPPLNNKQHNNNAIKNKGDYVAETVLRIPPNMFISGPL
jgi:hypothetical protein